LSALYKGCKPSPNPSSRGDTGLSNPPYTLRRFEKTDLPNLISLLNEAEKNLRDFRPYSEEEFSLNILQDEAFDPNGLILALEDHNIVGAAFSLVDPEYVSFQNQKRGFLRWIRVRNQTHADELRNKLLEASLKFIALNGITEALVSVPSHNQTDLDYYEKAGFTVTRRFNYMERPILQHSEDNSLPTGYEWTHFHLGEEAEWVNCINTAFKKHWGKRPTSLNEFSRWVADPAFDPTGVIGIRRNGVLVGVIYCEIDSSYVDYTRRKRSMLWIIGVIPSERGLGLGEKLTIQGLNWSASNGMEIAALFVDSENLPAVTLYQKLEFKTAYEVYHLIKPINQKPEA
jgi:ribosomal protein S18 acetylase RimI-like enzyme